MNKQDKNELLYEHRRKSPGLAAFLSICLIGAGSMYSGKVGWGFGQMAISLGLWLILMGWIMWIISPFLAYSDAKKYNAMLKLELDIK